MGSGASKQSVLVLGSSGQVGQATLNALCQKKHAKKFAKIKAGSRDIESLKAPEKVIKVRAGMGNREELQEAFKDIGVVFIIPPTTEDRSDIAINTINVAKESNISHIVLLSTVAVTHEETTFGKQFLPIENELKNSGISHTILRAPLFMDNIIHAKAMIPSGVISFPADGDKTHDVVAVKDVGKAAAEVMASPTKHIGKTYNLVSDKVTYSDVTAALSKVHQRELQYQKMEKEQAKHMYLSQGIPNWLADGVLELFDLVNNDQGQFAKSDDLQRLCRDSPLTLKNWVAAVKDIMKPEDKKPDDVTNVPETTENDSPTAVVSEESDAKDSNEEANKETRENTNDTNDADSKTVENSPSEVIPETNEEDKAEETTEELNNKKNDETMDTDDKTEEDKPDTEEEVVKKDAFNDKMNDVEAEKEE